MRMMSAPPAMLAARAIWPASRPITSRIITRSWLAAVGCNLSSASAATITATVEAEAKEKPQPQPVVEPESARKSDAKTAISTLLDTTLGDVLLAGIAKDPGA